MLSIKGIPGIIKENLDIGVDKVIFLYGGGICGTCPQGKFLYSLKERKDILFVVPEELNIYEKENLLRAFSIRGKIINGDTEVKIFLERLVRCSKKGDWQNNFYAELDKDKELKAVKPF
jgi:hypothetical protein